jgi:hypothetical protein
MRLRRIVAAIAAGLVAAGIVLVTLADWSHDNDCVVEFHDQGQGASGVARSTCDSHDAGNQGDCDTSCEQHCAALDCDAYCVREFDDGEECTEDHD